MTGNFTELIRQDLGGNVLPDPPAATDAKFARLAGRIGSRFSKLETLALLSNDDANSPIKGSEDEGDPNREDLQQMMRHQIYKQARAGQVYYPELLGGLLQARNPTDPYHWDTVQEVLPATTDMDRELRLTDPKRARWGGPIPFFFLILGESLSWATLSVFPWILFYSSSGYFFFATLAIIGVTVVVPILQLQHLLGQLYQGASVKVFSVLHPRTRGVGLATAFLSFLFLPATIKFCAEAAILLYYSLYSPSPWVIEPADAEFCQKLSQHPRECVSHSFCDFMNNVCFVSTAKLSAYFFRYGIYGVSYASGPLHLCPKILIALIAVAIVTCAVGANGSRLLVPYAVLGSILLLLLFVVLTSSSSLLKGASGGLRFLTGTLNSSLRGLTDPVNWTQALLLASLMGSILIGPQYSNASHNAIGTRIARIPTLVGILTLLSAALVAFATFGLAGNIIDLPNVVTRNGSSTYWVQVVVEYDTVIASGIFPGVEIEHTNQADSRYSIIEFLRSHKPVNRYRLYENITTVFPSVQAPLPQYIKDNFEELTKPIQVIPEDRIRHQINSTYCFIPTPQREEGHPSDSKYRAVIVPFIGSSQSLSQGHSILPAPKQVCVPSPASKMSIKSAVRPKIIHSEHIKCQSPSAFCQHPNVKDSFWMATAASLIFEVIPMGISSLQGSNIWSFTIFLTILLLGILSVGVQYRESINTVRDMKRFELIGRHLAPWLLSLVLLPLILVPGVNVDIKGREFFGRELISRLPEAATRLAFPTIAIAQLLSIFFCLGYEEQVKFLGRKVVIIQWISHISGSIFFASIFIFANHIPVIHDAPFLGIFVWAVWIFGMPSLIILSNKNAELPFKKYYWILLIGDIEVLRKHANSIFNSAYFPLCQYTFFWSICLKCVCPGAFLCLFVQQVEAMIVGELKMSQKISASFFFSVVLLLIFLGVFVPEIFQWTKSPSRNTWTLGELPHSSGRNKNKNRRKRIAIFEELQAPDKIWRRSAKVSYKELLKRDKDMSWNRLVNDMVITANG